MAFVGQQTASGLEGRNLRQQLLLTVLPLALLPVGITSVMSILWISEHVNEEAVVALKGQVLLGSEVVSNSISSQLRNAKAVAENPLVLDQVRRGRRTAAEQNLAALSPEQLEARFILNKQLNPTPTLNTFLARTAENYGFGRIVVTEASGLTVAYDSIGADPTRLAHNFVNLDESWWVEGKAQTQWVSDPVYERSTFEVGVRLAQAIKSPETGEFLGVVKVFIPSLGFSQLNGLLSNAGLRGTQQVQVLDTSADYVLAEFTETGERDALTPRSLTLTGGEVVNAIAKQLVSVNNAEQRLQPAELEGQIQSAFPVRRVVAATASTRGSLIAQGRFLPASQADDEGDSLLLTFDYAGKKYSVASMPGLDWVAVASMDLVEVQGLARREMATSVLMALGVAIVAVLAVTGLSRRLSTPLNTLSEKAQQFSAGDLDVVVQPSGSTETQTLAQTFNNLALRIKAALRQEALNTRRASLAAEITGANVTGTDELLPLYQRVVEEARSILQTDRMVIYRFNPDWSGAIVAESVDAPLPSAYEQQLGDPCIPMETLQKYLADGVLLEKDVANANFHPEHKALLQNLKVKSIMGVPVLSQGRLFGLLITHHCKNIHAWQPVETDFLKQIGLQVGLVIDRVNLLEQTRFLAEEQQLLREGLQRNALQLLMDVDPVSDGDLTARAKVTEDEIGTVADSYNATISSLRKIVGQVQEAARQVSKTTDTNQTSVRALSDSAAQQAAEILAALERVQDMANSVRLVSTSAEKAEMAVQQAAATVEAGDEAMNRTVEGFMAIRETVAETTKKVKRLGESSQKISNVVNLISGFAAQTNMLALNASIEASRAGEDGKGFAVVAEEVRELARQSAEATTEIEKLVASIQAETNAVVTAMEAGTEQVVAGTQLVDETRQNLNQITAVSRQISELVESIAQATVTQSQASENVTEVMNTVAAIATDNSTAANQVSQSFEQLRTVAQALENEVARFKVS
ncbi:MAG: GAF domain-containing protein [Cyanobacteria bacterium Co-bin13]|nr:GAF domain-containing protein [Cyanobacteria bacterium Co-bin13]